MTKDEAKESLTEGIKDNFSKMISNIMGDYVVDNDLGEALRKFGNGLHRARSFADQATKSIDFEFKEVSK